MTDAKRDPWTHKYPNAPEGAIRYLSEDSDLDLDGATAIPDPHVSGVWLVRMTDGRRAIVYLAGYPDPFGREREHNDFEVEDPVDEDERCMECGRELELAGPYGPLFCRSCDEGLRPEGGRGG